MHGDPDGQFCLWKFAQALNGGQHIPYAWQVTGSCVGAGGGNALRIGARVEIYHGDPEMYPACDIWWPHTYGQSRRRAGMDDEGEGSTGSAWAEAIVEDGIYAQDEVAGLPSWKNAQGWLQLTEQEELSWSRGSRWNKPPYSTAARQHLIKTASPIRSVADMKAALVNGYACTLASSAGFKTINKKGEPQVQVGTWDTTWNHQMSVSGCWTHPTLGLIFYIQNNWGPDAHPEPLQGEPRGGFWVTEATMAKILASRDCECYALTHFAGWIVRTLDWFF